ncbi:MAG: ABC transporter substrate-binding protein [Oscillospiraceae bacterium]|nr:ABC transporter substrate-binding protein [Oscillospiraceae bacterium]
MNTKVKKGICLVLALTMLLSMLTACGSSSSGSSATTATSTSGSADTVAAGDQQEVIDAVQAEAGIIPDYQVTVDETRKSTANTDEMLDYLGIIQKFDLTNVSPLGLYRSEKTIALASTVYESLFRRTGANEFIGVLAKEWEQTDEYLDVTIYDYIYDQDGNHITADDVIFSYDIYVDSGLSQMWQVSSYEKTGDYSVRFYFEQPQTGAAFRYSFAIVGIVSQKAYEDHNGMNTAGDACGTGPYKVVDFVASTYVEIEATGNYWQTPELIDEFAVANVKTVHVDIITDSAQQLIALQSGQAAYCALDSTTIGDFMSGGKLEGQYNLYSHLDSDTYGIMANCSEESIMSDINMRLACFYAIDTSALVNMLGNTMYLTCTVSAPRAAPDYQEEWDNVESYNTVTDYALVNEYLEKAGYNGETVVILCEENEVKKAIAEAAKNMLEAAGINCTVEVRPFALRDSELSDPTNWDLFMSNAGGGDTVMTRVFTLFSKLNGNVEGEAINFLHDDEFQEKISTCNSPNTYSDELADEIMHYIVDNALELCVCYSQVITAYDPVFANLMLRFNENKVIVTACDYYLD